MKNISKKSLDVLWQKAVCIGGKCLRCGGNNQLSGHHIIKCRHFEFRWDIINGACLCFPCHRFAEDHNQAFNREMGYNELIDDLWEYAREQRLVNIKVTQWYMEQKQTALKEFITSYSTMN